MAKSVKINFIFNLINTTSGLLFPLITFSYASRIIMAEGIGQVNFYNSIISYITLFSSIGIPLYGIREIARVRDSKVELSRTTIEILILNLLLNIVGYAAVAIICLTVSRVQVNIPLFLLLSVSIALTTIGCSWFYSGIEEFKYITTRNLIVKIISVVYLLSVVKTQDDLLLYGVYIVFGTIGNNILNFIRLRKYVFFKTIQFEKIDIWRHFKPAMSIFIFNIVTSIYLNLDKIMLGFFQDDQAVGYYTAATNLSHVLLYTVTSLGAVLLPRSSNLIKNNKIDEFSRLSYKAYRVVLILSCPITFGVICLAEPLIHLFCGSGFDPAIITLRIISPIIIIIGISNIVGMQVLYPLGKIKIVTISTCVGAALNFICNIIYIPIYSQNGAAFATVLAELSVTLTQIIIASKYIPFKIINSVSVKYICFSLLMFGICLIVATLLTSDIQKICILPITGLFVYLALLLVSKDEFVYELLNIIKTKIK
ncbi:flippase [Prevotella sp. P4-98]|uniref:flippase n=1 Tax=Prevotella sp. P4-98 TaxID=2024219 RepID=UPI000B966E9E|nr:flippase [Prevotella sp. P4-98]OYP44145.1 flippase [Prevotella sp. P4-98]